MTSSLALRIRPPMPERASPTNAFLTYCWVMVEPPCRSPPKMLFLNARGEAGERERRDWSRSRGPRRPSRRRARASGIWSMSTSTRLPSGGTIFASSLPSLARIVDTWLVRMSPGFGHVDDQVGHRRTSRSGSTDHGRHRGVRAARRTHFQLILNWRARLRRPARAATATGPTAASGASADGGGRRLLRRRCAVQRRP